MEATVPSMPMMRPARVEKFGKCRGKGGEKDAKKNLQTSVSGDFP